MISEERVTGPPALSVIGPPRWSEDPDAAVPDEPAATLLTIDSDGLATVFSGKVEYGQGVRSGFALAVADELDLPLESVEVVLGDTKYVPYDRGTVGSASTRYAGVQLRRAAATARLTLTGLAAERWELSLNQLTTKLGMVATLDDPGKTISYADLLRGKDLQVEIPDAVAVKDASEFTLMGRDATRIDGVGRVTGAARYTQDIKLPGMLYAQVLRPPSYGAQLQSADVSRAEKIPGVVSIVRDGGIIGVLAERPDIAEYAVESIQASWREDRPDSSDSNMPDHLKDEANELVVLRDDGELDAAFDRADQVFESTYYAPYIANATMEPSTAVAAWDGDELTIWVSNRGPFAVRDQLSESLSVPASAIRVIVPEVGGSFGTKSPTVAQEAAVLARVAGRPVRVAYNRDEEFVWSTVRPAAVMEIKSGVTANGEIIAWDYTSYHAGENAFRGRRGADTPYSTSNVRIAVADSSSPLTSGSYRSLGGSVNHFAREVHLDEIAVKLGIDPVDLRLRNLNHPRLERALRVASERFRWAQRVPSRQTGIGVAIGYDTSSFAAECVNLSVAGGEVHVDEVVVAFDCGLVHNPDGARNQIEGSIIMGMGAALWESVEFDGGRILNPSFSRYRVPRIKDAPDIDVVLTGDGDTPPTGAGEPAIVPIAAAIANGVRNATGEPIESIPIVPQLAER